MMKKVLFIGFIWEAVRFLYIYIFAAATRNFDMFMWMNSQQVVTIFAMFFLYLDFTKYYQYTKLMLCAKLFALLAGGIFIFKLANPGVGVSATSVLIPGIAALFDLTFLIAMIVLVFVKHEDEE